MRSFDVVCLFSIVLFSAFFVPKVLSQAACLGYTFSNNSQTYRTCSDLPVLSSSLHWTYDQSTGVANIAFRCSQTSSSQWISWGINPSGLRMVGTQALIAFQNSSGAMVRYTTPLESTSPTLQPGNLSFGVPSISAELEGNVMTIFATLQLAAGTTTVNQVWQVGPVSQGAPSAHSMDTANRQSVGSINLLSGAATGGSNSRLRRRNVSIIYLLIRFRSEVSYSFFCGHFPPLFSLTFRFRCYPGNGRFCRFTEC